MDRREFFTKTVRNDSDKFLETLDIENLYAEHIELMEQTTTEDEKKAVIYEFLENILSNRDLIDSLKSKIPEYTKALAELY